MPLYLFNVVAIAQSIYFGHPFLATFVLFSLILSQFLVYRENFLIKRRTKTWLDALRRIETCSPEEFEQVQIAMSQGMLTFSEVSQTLSRLAGIKDLPQLPLKEFDTPHA